MSQGKSSKRVFLVGVGRMGRLIARALRGQVDLVLVGRNPARLAETAQAVGAETAPMETEFDGAAAIILALPTEVTAEILQALAPRIPAGAVVINVATAVQRAALEGILPLERLVAAKVIGHSHDLEAGGKAMVIVEASTPEAEQLAISLFSHFSGVVAGREAWASLANKIAATEGLRAALRIQQQLAELGIPEQVAELAVSSVSCGTMRAYIAGTLGPFGRNILDKVRAEMEQK